MKTANSLWIIFIALLLIVSFFLPWWSTWNEAYDGWMSGWHRASSQSADMMIRFDSVGRIADVGRAPAPILYFCLCAAIGCLITGYLAQWEKIQLKTSAVTLAVLSICNLVILAYVLYTDHLPHLINVYLPIFWRSMYGLYASIFLSVCVLVLAIIGLRNLKAQADEQQIDNPSEPI